LVSSSLRRHHRLHLELPHLRHSARLQRPLLLHLSSDRALAPHPCHLTVPRKPNPRPGLRLRPHQARRRFRNRSLVLTWRAVLELGLQVRVLPRASVWVKNFRNLPVQRTLPSRPLACKRSRLQRRLRVLRRPAQESAQALLGHKQVGRPPRVLSLAKSPRVRRPSLCLLPLVLKARHLVSRAAVLGLIWLPSARRVLAS